jgi:hypothetical protein
MTLRAQTGPCAACCGSVAFSVVRSVRTIIGSEDAFDGLFFSGERGVVVRKVAAALEMRVCSDDCGIETQAKTKPPRA